MAKFKNIEVGSKFDVECVKSRETMKLVGNQGDQLKLMGSMMALLFAYQGVIGFGDTGIEGISNKATADAYVLTLFSTLWQPILALNTEADKLIKDNDLK